MFFYKNCARKGTLTYNYKLSYQITQARIFPTFFDKRDQEINVSKLTFKCKLKIYMILLYSLVLQKQPHLP
jgi:hypothetical protein